MNAFSAARLVHSYRELLAMTPTGLSRLEAQVPLAWQASALCQPTEAAAPAVAADAPGAWSLARTLDLAG